MKTQRTIKLVLIGCGNMAKPLLSGWLSHDLAEKIYVVNPVPLDEHFIKNEKVVHILDISGLPEHYYDLIVIAVKPQTVPEIAPCIKRSALSQNPILSIAAGLSLDRLSEFFGENTPIIRTMPNLPSAVGKGMCVGIPNAQCHESTKLLAQSLFNTVGDFLWIEDESLMDAVTALSGSGPAYVYYFIEALTKAGEKIGLPPDIAYRLARQTVIGSAALADAQEQTPISTLRENITSAKGTTEAGLKVLMNGSFDEIISGTLKAAKARSIELNTKK